MSEGHLITFAFVVCIFSAAFFSSLGCSCGIYKTNTRNCNKAHVWVFWVVFFLSFFFFFGGFLSSSILFCTWKIGKYNSPSLPGSLALYFPIIQLCLSWMTTTTISQWNEYNACCLYPHVQSLTVFPFTCRQVYLLLCAHSSVPTFIAVERRIFQYMVLSVHIYICTQMYLHAD